MPVRLATFGRNLGRAAAYALPALLLAWALGGQAMLGRIDALLAIPFLMPGALLLARLTRDADRGALARIAAQALLLLLVVQLAFHFALAERVGAGQLIGTLVAGCLCWVVAISVDRWTGAWRWWLRWPALLFVVAIWFGAANAGLAQVFADRPAVAGRNVVLLTGLPLRWAGGGDLAAMLAAGPQDAPALAALEAAVPLRVVDTLETLAPTDVLLLAHPRALAPVDLVRIDQHVQQGGDAVILADGLSSWTPPYPLGDPRNPPVTSLLTPLLDHWGVTLAAPGPGADGVVDVFIEPRGHKLRLLSAGRFFGLPPRCQSYSDRRIARCPIGKGVVWLVGDADLLHADLWQSPVASAPWLARSDNITWLASLLRHDVHAESWTHPLWIRPSSN